MKVSDININITEYLLQEININWCRENRQNYM